MSKRIEVEVMECGSCASLHIYPSGLCAKCGYRLGTGDRSCATIAPGTHSEAMYRLAKACLRLVTVGDSIAKEGENPERTCERYEVALLSYQIALADVRASAPPAPEVTT